ncbi:MULTISPECIES: hypothetical protein [Rhodanobacter]|uniref:hypothetical protein n=1 Tax=Rhodanobacter TaxID=75309 RepID=UPI000A6F4757|nr:MULTISPECIES: hypothetical protein [Rhodanobacter]UJJ49869.1 hypothetical protein LRK52_11565 [Rhodanobacter denitrificans]UJM92582.1 hypothetical protein LRK32_11475 [Rhodanobacter denitrificans]UJM96112.1 hypothetical protein LRK44_11480 [Rhodanobacter denitrificans]UJN21057.1 hypothetical protein LRK54_15160 [Rhodanobacter denitrificans]
MKRAVILLSMVAFLLFMGSAIAFDSPASGAQVVRITTTRHIAAGTAEYAQVQAFLQHPDMDLRTSQSAMGDFTQLGDFVVTWSRQVNGPTLVGTISPQASVPEPPFPPPGGHHAVGDTYKVSTCLSGYTQEWEYTYVHYPDGSSGWELTEYKRNVTNSCSRAT